jgi:2-iminobutanoate/2-iminopropanoate deaminase
MTQAFNVSGFAKPVGIFSNAAWQPEGKVLQISGHCSQDSEGNIVGVDDITAQTRQVLGKIGRLLDSVGGQLSDIVKTTIFVTDMSMLDEIHRVRADFFTPPYPASSLVQVSRLARAEYLIEIEAVAVIPFDRVKEPT